MATTGKTQKGKSGTAKYGRNQVKSAKYRAGGCREKNKARQMATRERKLARNRERRAAGDNSPVANFSTGGRNGKERQEQG